ncbi:MULTISPECIES: hypothetical protein [Arcicella]|uniref:Uncharacterized protein n=2 Tax=Arcicella TaxID=217140 RepID=A0ABU5SDJ2_9BACT|nr:MULTISPECIES: hypothetical protein [unclassified Arcicella]MEA5402662.1 hypothetical protein [Arcicella sp. DC2W]MEA5425340.1 hypothetical protein [Arcicella sp. DC25W]
MSYINEKIPVKTKIQNLTPSDRKRVEKAFKVLLPESAETRFINVVRNSKFDFDSREEAVLEKLFVKVNGKWKLNGTYEFFQLIGEELPMAL